MLIVLSVFLYLLTANNLNAQVDTIKLSSLALKGNVFRISELNFSAKDSLEIIVNDSYLDKDWRFKYEEDIIIKKTNFTYEFDKNGNLITKIIFNSNCYPYETTKYLYPNGLISEYNTIMEFSDQIIKVKYLCKYDNSKNLISITTYRNDEYLRKEIFKYDLKGHLIEKIEIDNEGNINDKEIYRYDNDLEIYKKRESESFNHETENKYDSLGRLIYQWSKWSPDLIFEIIYEYTDNLLSSEKTIRNGLEYSLKNYNYLEGKLLKETLKYGLSQEVIVYEYKYYPDNRIEILTLENDKQTIEEFDEQNNLTRLLYSYKDGNTEEYIYQYTFDSNKNWVKIVEYKNTIPLKIRLRKIKYY